MKQLLALSTALLAHVCVAAEPIELTTDTAKINYSVGYQIGGDLQRQGIDIQPETVIRGIQDAVSTADPLMTPEEMNITLGDLGKRIAAENTRKKYMAGIEYKKQAREFLAANAKKEGVVTTASGLQYRILEAGTGRTPGATDTVTVNYRGTLIDGTEFDSSYSRNKPATFGVGGVIPGWTEALQLMQPGDKWQLFIPPEQAYGERGAGNKIPPNSLLIFEVELISVN
jgi:FKBP-type peptidyl-prolyl cis-trans isomerase FklB